MNINRKVETKIRERSLKTRFTAFFLSLAVFVSFVVPLELVVPGVAMTLGDIDISEEFVGDPLVVNPSTITYDVKGSAGDSARLINVAMELRLDSAQISSIVSNGGELKIPFNCTNIDIVTDASGGIPQEGDSKDTTYSNNGGVSGRYEIYKESDGSGYVIVSFSPEYIQYIKDSPSLKVTGAFSGNVTRSDTQDGDKTVSVNGNSKIIEFNDKTPTISKDGRTENATDGEHPILNWTITVNNLYELDKAVISDNHLSNAISDSFSCNPDIYELSGGQLVKKKNVNVGGGPITITYKTLASDSELSAEKATNTASLTFNNGQPVVSDKTLNVPNKPSINKKYDGASHTINYGEYDFMYYDVMVKRPNGLNLKGYKIEDEFFGKAEWMQVVETNDNNATGAAVKYTSSGNTITIDGDADYVKITYKVPVSALTFTNGKVSNTAKVYPPNSSTPDGEKSVEVSKPSSKDNLYTVEKTAVLVSENNADAKDDYIKWQIKITPTRDSSTGAQNLVNIAGFTITDSAFDGCEIDSVQATVIKDVYTKKTEYYSNQDIVTLTGNQMTINDVLPGPNTGVSELTVTYKQPITDAMRNGITAGGTKNVNNVATVTPTNSELGTKEDDADATIHDKEGTVSVTGTKLWDRGSERPEVKLTLQRTVDGETWYDVEEKSFNSTNNWQYKWDKLPFRDANGKKYIYRLIEKNPPENYEPSYGNNFAPDTYGEAGNLSVTNKYTKIDATLRKEFGYRMPGEDKPDKIVFELYEAPVNTPENSDTWTKVEGITNPITLTKNSDNTYDEIKFVGFEPKNNYIYKVVEKSAILNGKEVIDDYIVTTSPVKYNNNYNNLSFTVKNEWKKMDVKVTKRWVGDEEFKEDRPAATFNLFKKVDGEWKKIDSKILPAGSSENVTDIIWHGLEKAEYKIEEEPVDKYTTTYADNYLDNQSGTIYVTNTSDLISVSANKIWVGINKDQYPNSITYKLQKTYTPEDESSWTDVDGSEKTANLTVENSKSAKAVWTKLLAKEDGKNVYYRIRETAIDGKDVSESFEVAYTSAQDYRNTTGELNITNTWKKMNLSVEKKWDSTLTPVEVKFELQKKLYGDNWKPVPGSEVTLKAGEIKITDAWTGLDRFDENNNEIRYRAKEKPVGPGADFYSVLDTVGLNNTGTSIVENKPNKYSVNVEKKWEPANAEKTPVKVKILQSIDGGATWETKGENSLSNGNSWKAVFEDLPARDGDKTFIYKVVEEDVPEGFNVIYSDNASIITSPETVVITNKQKPPYSKTPVNPTKHTRDSNKFTTDTTMLSDSKLTGKQLSKLDTAMVNINGEEKECYLFKWRLDGIRGSNTYVDTVPEGSAFYFGNSSEKYLHDIIFKLHYDEYYYSHTGGKNGLAINGSNIGVNVISSNQVEFSGLDSVERIVYFTAVPKEIVDTQLAEKGVYVVSNTIKIKGDQDEGLTSEITIESSSADSYINKIDNVSNDGTMERERGAWYRLEVNKGGKILSSGSMLSITDNFQITKYGDNSGKNIVDAELNEVKVYEFDENGSLIPLDESQYSYTITQQDGVYRNTIDYADKYNANNEVRQYDGICINESTANLPKGLQIRLRITHQDLAGLDVKIYDSNQVNALFNNPNFVVEPQSDKYDSNGSVELLVKVVGTPSGKCTLYVGNNSNKSTEASVKIISAIVVEDTEVTDNVLSLSVPDGKHLMIDYGYELFKPGTKEVLNNDDYITMGNEATIHTSGGDETASIEQTEYKVAHSAFMSIPDRFTKIVKTDVGDSSVKNLKAKFIIGRYIDGAWYYANDYNLDAASDMTVISFINTPIPETTVQNVIDRVSNKGILNLNGEININFDKDILYKIIEINSPDGYDKTPYDINSDCLISDMSEFTTYFVYGNTDIGTIGKPDNVGNIVTVRESTSLKIGNIKRCSIGASKKWEQLPAENDTAVKLALYCSHIKSDRIPNDAWEVTYPNFADGLNDACKDGGQYWLKSSESGYKTDEIWVNLPNGQDGKPLFYYVKEVAYKIGAQTYTLGDDGHYRNDKNELYKVGKDEMEYVPTYVNNGKNTNTLVEISNARSFTVQKIWQNKNGVDISAPVSEIQFKLTGIKSDGTKNDIILPNNTLSASNGWKLEIPLYLVSAYERFKVTEIIDDAQKSILSDFEVSDIYTLNGTVGNATLINIDTSSSDTSIAVVKEWDDKSFNVTHKGINVKLIQSTEENLSDSVLNALANDVQSDVYAKDGSIIQDTKAMLNDANRWSYTWTTLPMKNQSGQKYYYYVVELNIPEGYTATYYRNSTTQSTVIKNTLKLVDLTVKKDWDDKGEVVDHSNNTISFVIKRSTQEGPEIVTTQIDLPITTTTTTTTSATTTIEEATTTSTTTEFYLSINGTTFTQNGSINLTVGDRIITDVPEDGNISGIIDNIKNNVVHYKPESNYCDVSATNGDKTVTVRVEISNQSVPVTNANDGMPGTLKFTFANNYSGSFNGSIAPTHATQGNNVTGNGTKSFSMKINSCASNYDLYYTTSEMKIVSVEFIPDEVTTSSTTTTTSTTSTTTTTASEFYLMINDTKFTQSGTINLTVGDAVDIYASNGATVGQIDNRLSGGVVHYGPSCTVSAQKDGETISVDVKISNPSVTITNAQSGVPGTLNFTFANNYNGNFNGSIWAVNKNKGDNETGNGTSSYSMQIANCSSTNFELFYASRELKILSVDFVPNNQSNPATITGTTIINNPTTINVGDHKQFNIIDSVPSNAKVEEIKLYFNGNAGAGGGIFYPKTANAFNPWTPDNISEFHFNANAQSVTVNNIEYFDGIFRLQFWNNGNGNSVSNIEVKYTMPVPASAPPRVEPPRQAEAPRIVVENVQGETKKLQPKSARASRPLRNGNIVQTVGAEVSEKTVSKLFFNTNVSDIIEMGPESTSDPIITFALNGRSAKISTRKGDSDLKWEKVISGLPAVDENGNPYYYSVEELPVAGYTASYDKGNIKPADMSGSADVITITNTKGIGVELPETGGEGTKPYTTAGLVMVLFSSASLYLYRRVYRRRRWKNA